MQTETEAVTEAKARGKKPRKLPRGIFRRNGCYWIRYADGFGRLHREKAGPFLDKARDALAKRRAEICEGRFFPE